MNQDDIIRMAREAGAMFDHMTWVERDLAPVFERFAALVAAHEREECAKVCESGIIETNNWDVSYWNQACENAAFRIRARGEK